MLILSIKCQKRVQKSAQAILQMSFVQFKILKILVNLQGYKTEEEWQQRLRKCLAFPLEK